jgi:acetyl esterase/lipase
MTGRFEHFDARPGGSYRLVLAYADASPARKSAVDSDVVDAMGGHPSTPDHASTSGPTMCPTGSTLQVTRQDRRPRRTISPLPLNAERGLPRSTVLVATATIRVVATEGQIFGRQLQQAGDYTGPHGDRLAGIQTRAPSAMNGDGGAGR